MDEMQSGDKICIVLVDKGFLLRQLTMIVQEDLNSRAGHSSEHCWPDNMVIYR